MNYIKHLTGFFDKIVNDKSLNPTHISLYIGLFQFWNINRFVNPITITREEIMRISKIYSKATYHKCIKDLHQKGYIIYQPSFNPFKGSLISISDLSIGQIPLKRTNNNVENEPTDDQILNNTMNRKPTNNQTSHRTSSKQVIEQVNEQVDELLYIYNINKHNKQKQTKNENILNIKKNILKKESENFFEKNDFDLKNHLINSEKEKKEMLFAFADTEKNQTESGRQKSSAKKEKNIHAVISSEVENFKEKEKSSEKKEKENQTLFDFGKEENFVHAIISSGLEKPTLPEVKDFFSEKNFHDVEAHKFYNYFSSNGWLVGGKTPMVNWKAAAENWILNFDKFNPSETQAPKNNYLSTITLKDYSEPL